MWFRLIFWSIEDPVAICVAHISGSSTVKAGENIQLTCSITEKCKPRDQLHVYLCKNAAGVTTEELGNKSTHTFIVKNISSWDYGYYSCVYSLKKYPLDDVCTGGQQSLQVTGKRADPCVLGRCNLHHMWCKDIKCLKNVTWPPY